MYRIKLLPTFSYYLNSCFSAYRQVFTKRVTYFESPGFNPYLFSINRIAALHLWKQRTVGTYHDLLKMCCNGGDSRTGAMICDIVSKKAGEHG